ncbi:MAG: selenocysteine-specific elongation factor [Myxococcota bacterium]|jgi:selenocysteine-specific elongation factor
MTDAIPGLIVGTAGHIDHGKTSLVRVLTGTDLDQLPEEQARGITIALGFTALDLPDGRRAAFVDVPGHEKLVRTMISGATGIDAVLLCVSAVDGVMPQTREHLAILGLLGVRTGAVVLTMADLVDDELLELAQEDAQDAVEGTFLEGAPIIPFSAITLRGRDDVVAVVSGFQSSSRASDGPFRLPVDRAFTRLGFGTVVTGTAWSGELLDGATVQLLPGQREVRVRGIQTHGSPSGSALAGRRTALNLAGVEVDDVPRGTVVVHGDVPATPMLDVIYRHLPAAPPLEDGAPVRVLLGTAERLGHLHFAQDQEEEEVQGGEVLPAQLRLDAPLVCLPGDRFVLRRTSPLETLGGGEVVDPWTRRMRRRRRVAWGAQVKRLAAGETVVWLERAGEEGLAPQDWAARGGDPGVGEPLGGRLFNAPVVARLEGALVEALAEYHVANPLSLGAQLRELRRGRLGDLPERVFDALVKRLARHDKVQVDGPMVRVTGFEVSLTPDQLKLAERMRATLVGVGLEGLKPKDLHVAHKEPEVASLIRLMELRSEVEQVAGVGWMSSAVLDDLRGRVVAWFGDHEVMEPGDFKEITGLSRRAAIPLLEWLDRQRLTRREGNARVKGRALTV